MNKKTKQYLLLILVLAIWAALGYRFFSMLKGNEETVNYDPGFKSNLNTIKSNTAYNLSANYPDPFLKNHPKRVVHSSTSNQNSKLQKKNQAEEKKQVLKQEVKNAGADFPDLRLAGVIVNKVSGKRSVIMLMDGREYSLAAGESINGIKLTKVFSDSVVVVWQKKNKVIKM